VEVVWEWEFCEDLGVMGEVVRGTMDAEGDAEWANEPMKPTWEQIVAMQKESAALRAQAAAVLPALPVGVTPRSRRAPSRNEYPLFIPVRSQTLSSNLLTASNECSLKFRNLT
jgi:hypothetical protein